MRLHSLLAGCALALAAAGADAGTANVPYLTGRINDAAGVIPREVAARISGKLEDLEKRVGAQVVVLTVSSLEGEPIEGFSQRVADAWKLGRKGVDDGVLFLIVPGERKMRIEVGYGLEAKLTDLTSRRILDDAVAPKFRAGDIGGGVEAGIDAIIGVIEDKKDALPPPGSAGPPPFRSWPLSSQIIAVILILIPAGVFAAVAIGIPGLIGWALCLVVAYGYFYFLSSSFGRTVGIAVAVLWTVAFPILRIRAGRGGIGGAESVIPAVSLGAMGLFAYLVVGRGQLWLLQLALNPLVLLGLAAVAIVIRVLFRRRMGTGSSSDGSSDHSWTSASSSSSSSSSSGFSGGGGRFGGGGASSSW
jgi:uncharacterized protein